MEVKISFDTEKESVADLKGLVKALQDLINKKEGTTKPITQTIQEKPQPQIQPNTTHFSNPVPKPIEATPQNKEGRTTGGSNYIGYKDMSDVLSRIASGQKN